MAVGYSRRTSVRPSARVAGCSASSSWRCFSTPSFCRPGSTPSSWRGVVRTSSIRMRRVSSALRGDHPLDRAVLGGALAQGAGRRHPVQRLVGAAVGVHQHRPVGLDHQHPGGHRQVGGEPAGVVHLAPCDDESHGGESTVTRGDGPAPERPRGARPATRLGDSERDPRGAQGPHRPRLLLPQRSDSGGRAGVLGICRRPSARRDGVRRSRTRTSTTSRCDPEPPAAGGRPVERRRRRVGHGVAIGWTSHDGVRAHRSAPRHGSSSRRPTTMPRTVALLVDLDVTQVAARPSARPSIWMRRSSSVPAAGRDRGASARLPRVIDATRGVGRSAPPFAGVPVQRAVLDVGHLGVRLVRLVSGGSSMPAARHEDRPSRRWRRPRAARGEHVRRPAWSHEHRCALETPPSARAVIATSTSPTGRRHARLRDRGPSPGPRDPLHTLRPVRTDGPAWDDPAT